MNIYDQFGVRDFVVCAGYKGYMLKEYFANFALHNSDLLIDLSARSIEFLGGELPPWRIRVVDTGETTMTGGRLKRIGHLLAGDPYFLMTYGDGVADVNVAASAAFHERHGKLATMTVVRPSARFGSAEIEDGLVRRFCEKPQAEQGMINGGFFVLSPKVFDLIENDATVWEQGPLTTLAASGELGAFKHDGFWQPMDTLREKRLLEDVWQSGKAPWRAIRRTV
jgi:glucose-1-phosphate cytidylyltransferase